MLPSNEENWLLAEGFGDVVAFGLHFSMDVHPP